MNTELPKYPDDMPREIHQDNPHWLRNILVSLHLHSYVAIHWENNWTITNETGEPSGEWEMEITTATNKHITGKHEDIEKLLWFTNELAEAADDAAWKEQQEAKKAALAKLTERERRLLGISQ